MGPKYSLRKGSDTKRIFLSIFILFLVAAFLRALISAFTAGRWSILNRKITCVRIEGHQSHGGIGSILQRNQLALFLADRFNADLSFPHVHTEFEYNIEDFFSKCPPTPAECRIEQEKLSPHLCPLGDCDCRFRELEPYLSKLPSHCRVISIKNDGVRYQEYYGCYRNLIRRYFGGPKRWPNPYDAIHYRQGNLAHKIGKQFSKRQLANLINAMCKLSDRDLIVVTEGAPELPICGHRVVLAGNTSMEEALQIMQHAEHVSLGRSTFALVMADMALPKRSVMSILDYEFYRWYKSPHYTIVGRSGKLFHFDDASILQKAFNLGMDREPFNASAEFDGEMTVPSRRWETEALLTEL